MKNVTLLRSLVVICSLLVAATLWPGLATAQTPTPEPTPTGPELALFTAYPSQVVGIGETVNLDVSLRTGTEPQVARLEVKDLPTGWTASFRGGSKIIHAASVRPGNDTSITLKVEQPADVTPGTYAFTMVARSERAEASLPIELTVQDKVPPKLTLQVELPTLKGKPNTTFRYNATLKNEGGEDLTVNLSADAPPGFQVNIKLTGQEVANLPLEANQSKSLSIEALPFAGTPAGRYPITVRADSGNATASVSLIAEVAGESQLTVTSPDERLSSQAYIGEETPLQVTVRNTGSAPAQAIQLSADPPAGWTVTFDPQQIDQLPPNEQINVTARVKPSDRALAGDYMLTVRAKPADGVEKSAGFRITVLTTTLWGIVGVALIAVAVGVVALAVFRFGRR
jgi:uncharacterized membrane protein